MKIENISVAELIPYEKNSRVHSDDQVDQIAASINEFGFLVPVLVDNDLGIIAGHARVMAAGKLGLKTVPVLRADHLTEAQKKAYVITDNKLTLNASWDDNLLTSELRELQDLNFNIDLLGFAHDELDDLLLDLEDEEGLADPDEVPDVDNEKTKTKPGDLYILGNHRLLCGDSTRLDEIERLMDGDQADMVFTDPPYGVNYEGKAGKIANDNLNDKEFYQFLLDVFSCMFVLLRDGGAAYVAHADGDKEIVFRRAFAEAGLKLASCLIWRKNHFVLGRSDYHSQHEPILYGWKPTGPHFWHGGRKQTTIHEFDNGELFQKTGANEYQITLNEETLVITGDNLKVESALSTVVCEEKPLRSDLHPTMKPVALVERFILNSSLSNNLVLDLFGGSGSTMIAAEKTFRRARLVELDPHYCDVIVKRWEDYTGKKARLETV